MKNIVYERKDRSCPWRKQIVEKNGEEYSFYFCRNQRHPVASAEGYITGGQCRRMCAVLEMCISNIYAYEIENVQPRINSGQMILELGYIFYATPMFLILRGKLIFGKQGLEWCVR